MCLVIPPISVFARQKLERELARPVETGIQGRRTATESQGPAVEARQEGEKEHRGKKQEVGP